ncbi:MAG TPA: ion channel [Stellaceae bacterium]|nr:ion channel [Stellaceae bacterium]
MQKGPEPGAGTERDSHERAARVRLGSYEFRKKGVSRVDLRDPYHLAVALTWRQFFATLLAIYLLVNVVFAGLFWLIPGSVANARPHNFGDAFFFSIETLATVGYGEMYPATLYGHVIASTEIICGLGFTAILTGLTFVRFSRPRAKLVFASNPVVAMHNGKPTLMLRVGNGRLGVLLDAVAKLNVLLSPTSSEGKRFRRAQELRLERAHLPAFPLTWTLMHVLDGQSPLHGYDRARMIAAGTQVFVTLEARDPTLAAVVHDIRTYAAEDIRFGMRYMDAVTMAEDGTPVADLTRIGALEPDLGDHPESGWTEQEEASE